MDFTDHGALETIKWVLAQTPGTPPTSLFIQLHVGDPGADGTANPAVENTRVAVTFDAAGNVGVDGQAEALTLGDTTWVAVAATETYTHMSIWDTVTGGASWYKGALAAPVAVSSGSNFTFPAGSKLNHL